jgi:hypothetical protein
MNEANLTEAIKTALSASQVRKHMELWRMVSKRYPGTAYETFDRLMGKLELDGIIVLTGSRGPNAYKLGSGQ